jgi:hypothetical protein
MVTKIVLNWLNRIFFKKTNRKYFKVTNILAKRNRKYKKENECVITFETVSGL